LAVDALVKPQKAVPVGREQAKGTAYIHVVSHIKQSSLACAARSAEPRSAVLLFWNESRRCLPPARSQHAAVGCGTGTAARGVAIFLLLRASSRPFAAAQCAPPVGGRLHRPPARRGASAFHHAVCPRRAAWRRVPGRFGNHSFEKKPNNDFDIEQGMSYEQGR
jgi:hypothetical protein